jgi:hypothetical protein
MPRLDKERAEKNLDVIIDRLHNETDFALLKEYKKIYRKKLFLLRRSDVAAWLFMYYDQRETPRPRDIKKPARPEVKTGSVKDKPSSAGKPPRESKPFRESQLSAEGKPSAEDKPSAAFEITLGEEESKRLFISIGKNRRLFPRDIITLIMTKTSVAREDIGIIRILDNYSFVQVRDTRADEIIEKLTGLRFRGRTLTVNYAKPRSGEAEENQTE